MRQRKSDHAIFERKDASGQVRRTPVVMGKKDLTPPYLKLVMKQLGFTDAEIDNLIE